MNYSCVEDSRSGTNNPLFPPFHPPPIPHSTLVLNIPTNSTRSSPLKVAFLWSPGLMIFPTISSIMTSPCFSPSTMEIFGTCVPAFPVAMIRPLVRGLRNPTSSISSAWSTISSNLLYTGQEPWTMSRNQL